MVEVEQNRFLRPTVAPTVTPTPFPTGKETQTTYNPSPLMQSPNHPVTFCSIYHDQEYRQNNTSKQNQEEEHEKKEQ